MSYIPNSTNKTTRFGFSKVISNNVDASVMSIIGSTGSGMAVNQTAGTLVITSGTTARAETIIRSLEQWRGGVRVKSRSTLSQRIANNNFFIELVDVIGDALAYTISSATVLVVTFPSGHGFTSANVGQSVYIGGFSGTGTFLSGRYPIASVSGDNITFTVSAFAAGTGTCSAFGWNYYHLLYTGTTATQAAFDAQRQGWNTGDTTVTINTSASPGHMAIITANDGVVSLADQLVASATAITQTVRASRVEQVPEDINLKLQIRVANGSTAPATTTTWTIGHVSVSNYDAQDVALQDIKAMGFQTALPVEVLRAVAATISGTVATSMAAAAASPAKAEDAVHASGDVGIPPLGVRYETLTAPCAAGDYSINQVDDLGKTVTMPYAPTVNQQNFSNSAGKTDTADTAAFAAGAAGVRNYVSSVTVTNESATPTAVVIKDGSTQLWRGYVGANGYLDISFDVPLKGTAATAVNVANITTGANTFFTLTGFKAL